MRAEKKNLLLAQDITKKIKIFSYMSNIYVYPSKDQFFSPCYLEHYKLFFSWS